MSNPQFFVLKEGHALAMRDRLGNACALLRLLAKHVNLAIVYANLEADGVEELLRVVLEQVEETESDLEPVNLDSLDQHGRVLKAHTGAILLRTGVAHV